MSIVDTNNSFSLESILRIYSKSLYIFYWTISKTQPQVPLQPARKTASAAGLLVYGCTAFFNIKGQPVEGTIEFVLGIKSKNLKEIAVLYLKVFSSLLVQSKKLFLSYYFYIRFSGRIFNRLLPSVFWQFVSLVDFRRR